MSVSSTNIYQVCDMVVQDKNGFTQRYADKEYSSDFFNGMLQCWLVENGVSSQTAMRLAECVNAEMMKKCKTRNAFFSMFYTFLKLMKTERYSNDVLYNITLTIKKATKNLDKSNGVIDNDYKEVANQFIIIFSNIVYDNTDIVTMKDLCSILKIVLFKIVKFAMFSDKETFLKCEYWTEVFLSWLEFKLQKQQGTYKCNQETIEFERTEMLRAILTDIYVLYLLMDENKCDSTANFNKFTNSIIENYTGIIDCDYNTSLRALSFCNYVKERIWGELGYQPEN